MIGNWFEHMKEVPQAGAGHHSLSQGHDLRDHPNMSFFWYEDMKEDLRSVTRQVAAFLGKQVA